MRLRTVATAAAGEITTGRREDGMKRTVGMKSGENMIGPSEEAEGQFLRGGGGDLDQFNTRYVPYDRATFRLLLCASPLVVLYCACNLSCGFSVSSCWLLLSYFWCASLLETRLFYQFGKVAWDWKWGLPCAL